MQAAVSMVNIEVMVMLWKERHSIPRALQTRRSQQIPSQAKSWVDGKNYELKNI
jgi:hypothetical protein